MSFLAPLALWGLLALIVPVALHLRRRRVGRTIQVGSVRHLESLPTAERRGLRLREVWLLLLRSAVLAALVLLLARPVRDQTSAPDGAVALVDSASPARLRDSLADLATLLVERIDDPWRRLQELDDSLPAGMPVIVAAAVTSDRFAGPRPIVTRSVTWIPVATARAAETRTPHIPRPASRVSALEARALVAAVTAATEEFGPLGDTTEWQSRLPQWWADSIATAAFPAAVARVLFPSRALPPAVAIATGQLTPRLAGSSGGPRPTAELHWWLWALAVALFLAERLLAIRREGRE